VVRYTRKEAEAHEFNEGERKMKKKMIAVVVLACAIATILAGCREANRVTYNVQKDADNFNVQRQLTVLNARSDKILLQLSGRFSIKHDRDNDLIVTVETSKDKYKVDYVSLNKYTIYTVEDISGASVSRYHYELNFLPETYPPFTVVHKN
jgi:hypothetical protein